jgi:hypothetical protein
MVINTKTKFFILAGLVLITRFYDVYTTSLYTPDLNKESNPVVKWLGAGWHTMITLQIVLSLLIISCLYFYMFRYKPELPSEKGLKLSECSSYLLYGDKKSIHKLFYKLPDRNSLIASTGYVGAMVLITTSMMVGTSTLMLLLSDSYLRLYKQGIPYLFYVVMVCLTVYFYRRFFIKFLKLYQARA